MGGSVGGFIGGALGGTMLLGTIGGVLGIGGQAISAYQQMEAADEAQEARESALKEQKRQSQLAKRRADIKAARERVQLLRQQRRAVAESQTVASTTGASTGSGSAGAVGSIQSQTASAASFLGAQQSLGTSIFQSGIRQTGFMSDVNQAQAEGARWKAIGDISSSIFSAAGGWQKIGTML